MNDYIATFHTHFAALKSHRTLTAAGISARMAPVPRKISSSCGTCVFYQAEHECLKLLDEDTEAIYRRGDADYVLLREFE